MTLKECYSILGVARSAKLEDVKRAYRRRAFELHPDLNPKLVDAARQFQLLNEAYVTLSRVLTVQEAGAANGKAHTADNAAPENKTEKDAADSARAEKESKTSSGPAEPPTDTSREGNKAEKQEQKTAQADNEAPNRPHTADQTARRKRNSAYAQHEEVLRDILDDQFARRVFEDIYREVSKQETRTQEHTEQKAVPPAPPKSKKLNLEWGNKVFRLDLTHGITGVVKSWLLRQIDDSLTVRLPRVKLFPGARVRLQIRQGLNNDLRVVEVTLPQDFKPNKAIRLKGLGRKVGRWTGDLYLTVEPQD